MALYENNLDEKDLELLETYLDGELPVSEAEGLWRRLAIEPSLRAELDQLRAQRGGRLAVWEAMEPTDQMAVAVCQTVNRSMRRRNVWEWANRGARYVTAAAACLLVGIQIGGWNARGTASNVAAGTPASNGVAVTPVAAANGYQVAIRDSNGAIIASPQFDSKQEAVEFVDDLTRSQAHTQTREPPANIRQASDEQF